MLGLGQVLVVRVEGRTYYACGSCGLIYRSMSDAAECLEYCRRGACSVEVASRSVGSIGRPGLRLSR